MKLRKGNVFIHICLSCRRGGDPHTGTPPTLAPTPALAPRGRVKICSTLTSLYRVPVPRQIQLVPRWTVTPPPKHVQTCSLCSPDSWQAGGWHLTEMPSCLFWFSLSTTQILTFHMERLFDVLKENVTEH